jgi:hypothetical protein
MREVQRKKFSGEVPDFQNQRDRVENTKSMLSSRASAATSYIALYRKLGARTTHQGRKGATESPLEAAMAASESPPLGVCDTESTDFCCFCL